MRKNIDVFKHLGADLPIELVDKFRFQCEDRRFKKQEALRIALTWWLSLDVNLQRQMYHGTGSEVVEQSEDEFRQRVLGILQETQKIPVKKKSERRAKSSESA